jgi:hypothetical protein
MSQFSLLYFPPPVPIIQPEPPRLPIWRPQQQAHRIKAFRFLRENIGIVEDPSEDLFERVNKKSRRIHRLCRNYHTSIVLSVTHFRK